MPHTTITWIKHPGIHSCIDHERLPGESNHPTIRVARPTDGMRHQDEHWVRSNELDSAPWGIAKQTVRPKSSSSFNAERTKETTEVRVAQTATTRRGFPPPRLRRETSTPGQSLPRSHLVVQLSIGETLSAKQYHRRLSAMIVAGTSS